VDKCIRCGGNYYLGGNVDLCAILCCDCQDEFNAWDDIKHATGEPYFYSDFLKEAVA